MFRNHLSNRLRLIDALAPEGGGTPQPDGQGEGGEPVDWEAKYREAIGHSREWEKKAKANRSAADELEKLKESQMSESEKTAKRISELEAENAAMRTAQQRNEWRSKVSAETGVPAALLHGDSLEDMQANAKAVLEFAHPAPKLPKVDDPAKQPSGKTADQSAKDYVARLFGETD